MPSISATARTGLLALSALALAATGILPPAAAGPDDGRPIATASHLDSPQVAYADGQLTLTSKGNIVGRSGYIHPLDSHIVYSGTGYAFAFLNAADQTWYMAPQVPVGNHEPIWIGFGGDTSIPADKFRDGMVYLDLIGVRGPGRVEALGFYRDGDTWHTSQMLSSKDPAFRNLAVYPGDHTHNATLFSRPGRYELTCQASARLADGTIVRSRPTVQTWQVGGAKPAATATPSLTGAFDVAPAGQPATPYTFKAAPTPGELTGREDGRLTTFSFDSYDPKVRGILNLSLNGFHFTDIPVRDGKASASYYAGGADSTQQATFVPEVGSAAPRWRSEPLAFSAAARTVSASSQAAEAPPVAEQPAPSPRLDFPPHAPTDRSYTITVTLLGGDRYRTDLTLADTAIRGKMTGGIFEPSADRNAESYREPHRSARAASVVAWRSAAATWT
ncbi:surface-anchored protein [Bowdeniella nasicola]|uniref:Surface-anchored protein n=1 Tax=Bowdeniella nasicola TaxID=208480 RepID=A0A1H3WUH9_9ACTO|nr:choice-of-anchor M domain-containing protein [Bowdeniella nasicola]SDZ90783.1 surface-anchored protein [Bowdeniella nasicola]